MDYTTIAVAFGMLTLFLIVAEFFVPSGGLISLGAIVCGTISVWGANKAWADTRPVLWWSYLAIFFTLIPGAMFLVLGVLPKTKYGKRLFLEPKPAGKSAAIAGEREKLASLIGKSGRTATLHTPGGMVIIEGKRYHSESEGVLIEPETDITVIAVRASRLLIRETTSETRSSSVPPREPQSDPLANDDLDFRFPEE